MIKWELKIIILSLKIKYLGDYNFVMIKTEIPLSNYFKQITQLIRSMKISSLRIKIPTNAQWKKFSGC